MLISDLNELVANREATSENKAGCSLLAKGRELLKALLFVEFAQIRDFGVTQYLNP